MSNYSEDNEKVIVLLSDGAQWSAQQENSFQVKVEVAKEDAVLFADNLYDEGEIRIHTVAISNEDNLRRYERHAYFEDMNRPEGERI